MGKEIELDCLEEQLGQRIGLYDIFSNAMHRILATTELVAA